MRAKAKDLTGLLNDDERIRDERSNRSHMHSRINSGRMNNDIMGASRPERLNQLENPSRNDSLDPYGIGVDARSVAIDANGNSQLDPEMRQAIAESKLTAMEEESRRRERETISDEDEDLARALKLSEEEARRQQQRDYYEAQRSAGQFHQPQPTAPVYSQNTGYQPPFQSPFPTGQQQAIQSTPVNNTDLLIDIFGTSASGADISTTNTSEQGYQPQKQQRVPTSQSQLGTMQHNTTQSLNSSLSPFTGFSPPLDSHSNSPFTYNAVENPPRANGDTHSPFSQSQSGFPVLTQDTPFASNSPFAQPPFDRNNQSPFSAQYGSHQPHSTSSPSSQLQSFSSAGSDYRMPPPSIFGNPTSSVVGSSTASPYNQSSSAEYPQLGYSSAGPMFSSSGPQQTMPTGFLQNAYNLPFQTPGQPIAQNESVFNGQQNPAPHISQDSNAKKSNNPFTQASSLSNSGASFSPTPPTSGGLRSSNDFSLL